MEIAVYNPQKGRYETIDAVFTPENTTWFDSASDICDIYMITDCKGGLLISELNYTYPFLIYDISRADIGFDPKKARAIRDQYE
jgi:hypothetical protein